MAACRVLASSSLMTHHRQLFVFNSAATCTRQCTTATFGSFSVAAKFVGLNHLQGHGNFLRRLGSKSARASTASASTSSKASAGAASATTTTAQDNETASAASPSSPFLSIRAVDTMQTKALDVIQNIKSTTSDDMKFYATIIGRIIAAFGIAHVIDEYGVQLTRTEGPSMLPTIKQTGDIVVMEKFAYIRKGLKDGDKGEERSRSARIRQLDWEASSTVMNGKRSNGRATSTTDNDGSTRPGEPIWHEARSLPASHATNSTYGSLWRQLTTPLSVGDVVVVQRPGRMGTVCKRIVGLPGDIIVRPRGVDRRNLTEAVVNMRAENVMENMLESRGKPSSWPTSGSDGSVAFTQKQIRVVPDGHIWVEGDNSLDSVDSRSYGPVPAALMVGRVVCRVWPLRGDALLGRGARPVEQGRSFSGSIHFPAGYEGERIVIETEVGR